MTAHRGLHALRAAERCEDIYVEDGHGKEWCVELAQSPVAGSGAHVLFSAETTGDDRAVVLRELMRQSAAFTAKLAEMLGDTDGR